MGMHRLGGPVLYEVLLHLAIYLAAAVIAVPISQGLGVGSVLGYLAAGLAIGPAMHLVGSEAEAVQEYAEYGILLMLFLINLEMRPQAPRKKANARSWASNTI